MEAPRRALIVAAVVLIAAALAACGSRRHSSTAAPILLFDGTGTSPNDVAAVAAILDQSHLDYSTVNSARLNEMDESEIRAHRLLIVPGGNFVDIGNGLTADTTA